MVERSRLRRRKKGRGFFFIFAREIVPVKRDGPKGQEECQGEPGKSGNSSFFQIGLRESFPSKIWDSPKKEKKKLRMLPKKKGEKRTFSSQRAQPQGKVAVFLWQRGRLENVGGGRIWREMLYLTCSRKSHRKLNTARGDPT